MTEQPDSAISPAWSHWIEAIEGLGIRRLLIHAETIEVVFCHIALLIRAQYGTELSWQRLQFAQEEYLKAIANDRGKSVELAAQQLLDVHALIVSANLFWETLKTLQDQPLVKDSILAEMLKIHKLDIERLRNARNHIEHLSERITKGRESTKSIPASMSPQSFRRAFGQFDGRFLQFGEETFDIGMMVEPVKSVGQKLSVFYRDRFQPSLSLVLESTRLHIAP